MALERERAIFEAHRLRWLLAHAHQYVLIIGDDVLGFYDLPERAYTAGLTLRGNVPMLIQEVVEVDEVVAFPSMPGGRRQRSPEAARQAWEQACRQRWRALVLVVKAKLEAVETGITTFEQEFMAHIVLPDGKTVGERVRGAIAQAYATGKTPRLLLEDAR